VAPAALALAEHLDLSGREMLDAIVLGIEVSCRVGNAIYPDHYDRGWHITGSTGMLGSAAACARLLKLDLGKTQMALGIAASQPIGVREQFGTMTKPFHPGGAARVGLMSALMAQHGYTASRRALEAPRGLLQVFSDKTDWSEITGRLGQTWEIALNTYKPFACGIVIHPSIDACVQLRDKFGLKATDIERVSLRVHSLVLELTGKKTPTTGLESKFSVYHSCAVGLLYGQAGEHEYTDEVVNWPEVTALRAKVDAIVDDRIDEAAADITILMNDGRELHLFVEHAIGSVERPMSDSQLQAKFAGQSEPVLGSAKTALAWTLSMGIAQCSDLREFIAATTL
jgi:2-methylcitrate dehydratase PrpD